MRPVGGSAQGHSQQGSGRSYLCAITYVDVQLSIPDYLCIVIPATGAVPENSVEEDDTELCRPTEYLRHRCPLCFGGKCDEETEVSHARHILHCFESDRH